MLLYLTAFHTIFINVSLSFRYFFSQKRLRVDWTMKPASQPEVFYHLSSHIESYFCTNAWKQFNSLEIGDTLTCKYPQNHFTGHTKPENCIQQDEFFCVCVYVCWCMAQKQLNTIIIIQSQFCHCSHSLCIHIHKLFLKQSHTIEHAIVIIHFTYIAHIVHINTSSPASFSPGKVRNGPQISFVGRSIQKEKVFFAAAHKVKFESVFFRSHWCKNHQTKIVSKRNKNERNHFA